MIASTGLSERYKVETYSVNAKIDIEFRGKHVLYKARSKKQRSRYLVTSPLKISCIFLYTIIPS